MMENQKVVLVKLADLKPHPELTNVYQKLDRTELFERMRSDKTLLKLPVIDQDNHEIDGIDTNEFARQQGEKEIYALQIYVPPGQAALVRVKCHQIRERSLTEKYFELQLLEKFYPKRQGYRNDLVTEAADKGAKNSRKELAARSNLSDTEVFRIRRFADKNLLAYADAGEIPKTALDKAASEENHGNLLKKYTPSEVISLKPGTCCNTCNQPTGRIVFTNAAQLEYRNNINENDIQF